MSYVASIPSPSQSVWHLGPIPVRAYALCIVLGIVVAMYVADRRLRVRGGNEDMIWNVAKWAVPFGILGGRIYHVITDPELYFLHGNDPVNAFKIWDGGLGIPGAIVLGMLGAYIGCRRQGLRLDSFCDVAVPGLALAQAIGRWGNWFNNELYGRPSDLPWKLEIHDIAVETGHSQSCTFGNVGASVCGYYQPTFLYESLWNLALAGFLVWAGKRWVLGNGRIFALYAMGYAVGRFWVEALRSDPANHILGLRINTWTSMIAFVGGLIWFLTHRGPREKSIFLDGHVRELAETDSATGANADTGASSGQELETAADTGADRADTDVP